MIEPGPPAAQPFIGRGRELQGLEVALREARNGHGRLVILVGDAGIGKTRTVEEFVLREQLPQDQVLWGRCPEQPGAPPYWPWCRALATLVASRELERLRDDIGADGGLLAQLVPSVRDRVPDAGATPPVDPEQARFRLFEAVTAFLRRAAGGGLLVLVLEDLHWADEASLQLLGFAAGELRGARVLLIGTCRERQARRGAHALADISRAAQRLTLHGLQREDVDALAADVVGRPLPAAVLDRLHATTEGNPFFVEEVLQSLRSTGVPDGGRPLDLPATVREAVRRRLEPLAPADREMLSAAAVLGREFDTAVLRVVCELEPATVLERLAAAVDLGLVAEHAAPGRFRFTHALIRETLYSDLMPAPRVRLHHRVATVLEARAGADGDVPVGELAVHFSHAAPLGESARALEYASRAARHAMRLFAWDQAVEHYTRALTAASFEPPDERRRLDLRLRLGEAARRGGNGALARETFALAARSARALADATGLVTAAMRYATVSPLSGTVDPVAVGLLEEALTAAGPADTPLRAILLALLAQALYFAPDRGRCEALAGEAVEVARRVGEPLALGAALLSPQLLLVGPGSPEERRALADETIALGQAAHSGDVVIVSRLSRIMALLELGDVAEASAEVDRVARDAEETQLSDRRWLATVHRASLALLAGRLEEATRLAAVALAIRHDARDAAVTHVFWAQTFLIRREAGDPGGLEAAVRALVAEYPALPIWRSVLALLLATGGDPAGATRLLADLRRQDFADLPPDCFLPATLACLADLAVVLGDEPLAEAIYARLRPFAARNIVIALYSPGCLGSAERYLGVLAAVLGRTDDAVRHLEAAVAMNARLGAPTLLARAQHDLARVLLRRAAAGDRERATALIEEARAKLGAAGARRLEQLIGADGVEHPPATRAPSPAPIGGSGAVLRREGEYWSVEHGEQRFRLKDSKGIRHLALLLRHPGREFHVLDMESGSVDATEARQAAGDAGEMLDPSARAAYRSRLEDLRDEVNEAERFNDIGRRTRAEREMEFLAGELARAVGLGGRDRRAASAAERARVNVSRTIAAVLRKVAAESPVLGQHLGATVRTGLFCSYTPDPRLPIAWTL